MITSLPLIFTAVPLPDHVVTKAEEHWLYLLHNLREIGTEVVYKDITILSTCASSSSMEGTGLTADAVNEFVVIFILQLLGLKSSWQSAKVSLFKEPFPFIKFLREVEPLSLPIRRVRKVETHIISRLLLALSLRLYEFLSRHTNILKAL